MVRRKLFVPRPSVWSLENFNAGLPDRCLELAAKPHCRKDTEERGPFSEDRTALLPLPGKRFDVGRVAAYEGRPVRRGHARGTASLFRGPGERGATQSDERPDEPHHATAVSCATATTSR